ncbi:MFS transporter [Novosphingobium aquae]|uniref:MFS transporter n=1 Tax=Novosphingobium aquae TaxID=3133435 RepID=A0ABU8SCI0_9SPHN
MTMPDRPQSSASGYWLEVREHRRALVAASAGLASGFLLNHYVANIFGPQLIEAFGWTRSQFALVGAFGMINLATIPLIGRLTDRIGIRPVATVGIAAFPLTFVAMSQMGGSFETFVLISLAQYLLCGATTTSIVYSRLVAERFAAARGLALAIGATAPAVVGIVGSPLLQALITREGWRTGYLAVALYVALVGAFALAFMPRDKPRSSATRKRVERTGDYPVLLRSRTFWTLFFGFLLCNLIYPLQSSQLMLMLAEQGIDSARGAWMVSLFAGGVLAGRFLCGIALDRFPSHYVAAVALGLPGLGLLAMSTGLAGPFGLAVAVVVMGLSLGAESDLAAYLVMRHFELRVYGTVLGLVVTSLALSASLGSIMLSATLALTGSFTAYLLLSAAGCLIGALLFLLLGKQGDPTVSLT